MSSTSLVFHLLLLHFGSLLQAFDRCLAAVDNVFALCQFDILLLNQSIFGKGLAVQLLQHGLQNVS